MSFNVLGQEQPENVPVYRYGDDGRVQNIRPTSYFRDARADVTKHQSRGGIGYIVENNYGDRKPMTFLQAHRLQDLFERGNLKIVEYLRTYDAPGETGLTGFDTESAAAFVG